MSDGCNKCMDKISKIVLISKWELGMEIYLSKMIDQKVSSVNELIRNCGIDRSTFYKIKSGRRPPTKEQFCAILNEIQLTEEEKIKLIEEYEYLRYWKPENKTMLTVARQFLRYLSNDTSEKDRDVIFEGSDKLLKQEIPEEILSFFRNEVKSSFRKIIKAFLPSEILERYNWKEMFSELGDNIDCLSFQILLVPHDQNKEYDVIRKMRNIEVYFDLVNQTGLEINVYRDRYLSDKLISDPYPYWLIGTESMIRIRDDLDECFSIENLSVISKHTQNFDRRVSLAYRILKRYFDLSGIVQDLSNKCLDTIDEGKRLYVMSTLPCTSLAVSDEIIRKYCPVEMKDMVCQYHYLISAATYAEFITRSGYNKMLEDRTIPEWTIDYTYPESEMNSIKQNILERYKKGKLFFLSDISGYVPDTYSLAMFEDKEINVQSLKDPSLVIQIRETEMIEAIQKWFEYRDEIAWIEEELELR